MSNMTLDSLRVQKESSNNKKLNALFEFDNQLWNAQIIKMGLTLTQEVMPYVSIYILVPVILNKGGNLEYKVCKCVPTALINKKFHLLSKETRNLKIRPYLAEIGN